MHYVLLFKLFRRIYKCNPPVLELDFSADIFFLFSFVGIWTRNIV